MSQVAEPKFGKWRSLLWPIHNFELKKLLPLFFMFFLISFNYTILRDMKDTLIITAPGSGAEAVPFLKGWGVLPFAVLFMLIYAKLSNKLGKAALFYATLTPFLVFFTLFALVLYPYRDSLHPTEFADYLQANLPQGFTGLIALLRNWTFALFYILSELWGSVALSLLFWGFANDIMKVTEAKRFYTVLMVGANLALIVSGPLIQITSQIKNRVPEGVDAWGITLNILMSLVVLGGLAVIGLYYWVQKNVLTDPRFYNPEEQVKVKKSKPKMSIVESFKFLMRSKYIGCLALLVMSYGVCINIVEVTWKSQIQLQYPNPNDYMAFMGGFSFFTGIFTTLMTLFVGGNIIRKLGWGFAATTTPVVLLVTGAAFFTFVIFREHLAGAISALGTTPLFMAVVLGMVQNILSKSTKYVLFDPTKEMAYIPLDQESKVKGKAAVDVVGARLGKSGGSFLQQGLILSFGSIAAVTPILGAVLLGITLVWLMAVRSLNRQFTALSAEKEAEKKVEVVVEEATSLKKEATTSS